MDLTYYLENSEWELLGKINRQQSFLLLNYINKLIALRILSNFLRDSGRSSVEAIFERLFYRTTLPFTHQAEKSVLLYELDYSKHNYFSEQPSWIYAAIGVW